MRPVVIAPTVDRSVVGIMVDFAKAVAFDLARRQWDETTLPIAEARLAATPCHAKRRSDAVVFPEIKAPELLVSRWENVSP